MARDPFASLSLGRSIRRKAPAFTAREIELIVRWRDQAKERGLRTEIKLGHQYLSEALHVSLASPDEPRWLVHKTPDGLVAVRQWPGVAEIVPTLADALAIITDRV
jgi:hypothetical protein